MKTRYNLRVQLKTISYLATASFRLYDHTLNPERANA